MSWMLQPINTGGYIDTVNSTDYLNTISSGSDIGTYEFGKEVFNRYFYITDENDPIVIQSLVFEVTGISNPSAISNMAIAIISGTYNSSVLTTLSIYWGLFDNKLRIWFSGTPNANATSDVKCEVGFFNSSSQRVGYFQFTAGRGQNNKVITFRAVNPSNTSAYTSTKQKSCAIGSGVAFYPAYTYSAVGAYEAENPDQIRILNIGSNQCYYYNDVNLYGYVLFGPHSNYYIYIDINYYNKYYENFYYLRYNNDTPEYELLGNYWVGSQITAPSSSNAGSRTGMEFKNWSYYSPNATIEPNATFRIQFDRYKLGANWEYLAIMKVRLNGEWKDAIVYVAKGDEWVIPTQVLVRQGGTWKNSIR